MSDSQRRTDDEDAEQETTDVGEGERGVISPGRRGTFDQTPGEVGDRAEDPARGPRTVPPHRQAPE
jgi:hypothetical protein